MDRGWGICVRKTISRFGCMLHSRALRCFERGARESGRRCRRNRGESMSLFVCRYRRWRHERRGLLLLRLRGFFCLFVYCACILCWPPASFGGSAVTVLCGRSLGGRFGPGCCMWCGWCWGRHLPLCRGARCRFAIVAILCVCFLLS